MWQIGDKLNDIPAYTSGCHAIGVTIPPLSWVDDLAIPVAVTDPAMLIPVVQEVITVLHDTFRTHGMTMNFEEGKSETVIMYRGAGAAKLRTALFDTERQPKIIVSTPSHILSMRVVATYRHLGARFMMDADIDYEIKLRMSMARQAFEELKRPLFSEPQHPPERASSIVQQSGGDPGSCTGVQSGLMFPEHAQLQLDSVVIDHQRRMAGIGFWNGAEMTDDEFRHHLEVSPFRVTWACNRLIYLQHVAQHAAPFHKTGLLLEFATSKGWLWEVATDIAWMSTLVELPFEFDFPNLQWQNIWDVLSTCTRWKASVRRAERKHVLQERIARDVQYYHGLIVQELVHFGLDVWKGDDLS